MARASVQVLPLSVSSYLVLGRRVTPMIYRQVSVKWPKLIAVGRLDQQLAWSLWLGLHESCSHQTWRGHGQSNGRGAAIVCFIVSCRGPARHTNDLPPSKCEMAKSNCCRYQQLPWLLWLGLQASCSHQTWRGHGQMTGPGAAVVRFIVFCTWLARHTNDLPQSKCEMAKVNCCRPLRPAVVFVAVAQPAGKLQPPNLVWAWPEHWPMCCRCPFHRILSWAGASHQ